MRRSQLLWLAPIAVIGLGELFAGTCRAEGNRLGDPRPGVTGRNASDLEYARLAQEKELKLRELEIRERELQLQRNQQRTNWWSNPALVAIVAGLIGYLSTLYSTLATRKLEADRQKHRENLESEKHKATLELERQKQEGTLILESIKTVGTGAEQEKRTAANLVFLADAGLITSIKPADREKLQKIAGASLPSLPAARGVEFRRSPALTAESQARLSAELARYQNHLAKLGIELGPSDESIEIGINDDTLVDNAYYEGKKIVVGSLLANSPEYLLYEYTWYALKLANKKAFDVLWYSASSNFLGYSFGMRDYFVCSYLNNSRVGENYYALIGQPELAHGRSYLRDLKEFRPFNADGGPAEMDSHRLGEVWGGAFWEIREKMGRDSADPTVWKADRLIMAAWKGFEPSGKDEFTAEMVVDALLEANKKLGLGADPAVIRKAFARRNLIKD